MKGWQFLMAKMIYAGKAKQLWTTDDEQLLRVVYTNQATALNGKRKDQISGKGELNNQISTLIFEYLSAHGIPTHFVKKLSATEEIVKRVKIIPLEVVTRNLGAGHFASRFGVKEGLKFSQPVEELYYKSDELADPFMNESQAAALGIANAEEIKQIWEISRQVNQLLSSLFAEVGLDLVDFKLEFGKTANGEIILADEFSPDNCRLWDQKTKQHMDKDVFRRDLGDLAPIYQEVLRRLTTKLGA